MIKQTYQASYALFQNLNIIISQFITTLRLTGFKVISIALSWRKERLQHKVITIDNSRTAVSKDSSSTRAKT